MNEAYNDYRPPVTCPKCGAAPGRLCLAPSGRPTRRPHRGRSLLCAQQAAERSQEANEAQDKSDRALVLENAEIRRQVWRLEDQLAVTIAERDEARREAREARRDWVCERQRKEKPA